MTGVSAVRAACADLGEAVLAARLLRERMAPRFPLALIGSESPLNHLQQHPTLRETYDEYVHFNLTSFLSGLAAQKRRLAAQMGGAWQVRHRTDASGENLVRLLMVGKMVALLMSPYEVTVYLDNDVLVLQPTLMDDLLSRTMRIADLAMPVALTQGPEDLDFLGLHGLPQLCTAMIVYRQSNQAAVSTLVQATFHMINGTRSDVLKPANQREQEYLYLAIADERMRITDALRVFALPHEYYCPFYPGQELENWWLHEVGRGTLPAWPHSWGRATARRRPSSRHLWSRTATVPSRPATAVTPEARDEVAGRVTTHACQALHGHLSAYNWRGLGWANLTHLRSSEFDTQSQWCTARSGR